MLYRLLSRFPNRQNIVSVFSVAAFLVYGWTIYSSFNKIPSWILYLYPSEIVSIYAYSFLVNFLECTFLVLILLGANFLFAGNLWKHNFLPASVVIVVMTIGSAIVHLQRYANPDLREDFLTSQRLWWGGTFVIALVSSIVVVRMSWFSNLLENLAERFTVFLYLYVPLTVISVFIVLYRIFI